MLGRSVRLFESDRDDECIQEKALLHLMLDSLSYWLLLLKLLLSQRLVIDLATETSKYLFPRRFEPRNFEGALMSVPDLETMEF
ncbi:hypothetical protein ACET3Z_010502 [Daucus carota]